MCTKTTKNSQQSQIKYKPNENQIKPKSSLHLPLLMRMCCYSSLQLEILDQSWALHLLFASQEDQKQKQTMPSQTQMKPEEKIKKQNQIQFKSKQKPKQI